MPGVLSRAAPRRIPMILTVSLIRTASATEEVSGSTWRTERVDLSGLQTIVSLNRDDGRSDRSIGVLAVEGLRGAEAGHQDQGCRGQESVDPGSRFRIVTGASANSSRIDAPSRLAIHSPGVASSPVQPPPRRRRSFSDVSGDTLCGLPLSCE